MKISNYDEVRDALYHRESFVHGSCHAVYRRVSPVVTYHVWSYSTLILRYDLDTHTVVMFDNRRYSQTTSRLQSMIRAAFPEATGGHTDRVVYDY